MLKIQNEKVKESVSLGLSNFLHSFATYFFVVYQVKCILELYRVKKNLVIINLKTLLGRKFFFPFTLQGSLAGLINKLT